MSPAARAVVFALLLLVPLLPAPAAATHWQETVDVPDLPPARPDAQCAETAVPARVLNAYGQARDGNFTRSDNVTYWAQRQGVPLLCVQGRPVEPYVALIREADGILENLRRAAREAERQADQRGEASLPEGSLLRPTFPILDDRFDGHRKGGFGDWTVVTRRGEPAAFRVDAEETPNGTVRTWRFGDPSGYARGAHQWLVSPELDLTAVKSQEEAYQALLVARAAARDQLREACNRARLNPGSPPALAGACGDGADAPLRDLGVDPVSSLTFRRIFEAYEAAFDDVMADVPAMHHAATLDVTYRMNLASQVDGVRVWLYRGERAPDRATLFAAQFGTPAERAECATRPAGTERTGQEQADLLLCTPRLEGGKVLHDLPGAQGTFAFREDAPLSRGGAVTDRNALTGDRAGYVTARVNLTEYAGERLWLLFEVKTVADSGRGDAWFDSASVFPRQKDFGFQLAHVNATGEGHLRNFRLKDVGGDLPAVPRGNPFGDNSSLVSTTTPGPAAVRVRLHNAGQSTENGTVLVRLHEMQGGSQVPVAERRLAAGQVRPGEVRVLHAALDTEMVEDRLYRYEAILDVEEARGLRLDNVTGQPTRNLDPDATAVRANNTAYHGIGGNLTANVTVRAYTRHALTPVKASGDAGPALEACGEVSASFRCAAQPAARKGEARTLLMGVRNDGNAPEDAKAVLHLTLDGADKSAAVLDGAARDLAGILPGELRALRWTLNPTEPGVYDATVFVQLPGGATVAQATRLLFVQRSTGLVCLDDFATTRECGPSFEAAIPDALRGRNATAMLAEADGLWVATETSRGGGDLLRRDAQGAWTVVHNLSQEGLGFLPRPRADLGFGSVREMVRAPDGTLYMVGGNLTVLARGPDGGLARVPLNFTTPHAADLAAAAWWNGTLYAVGTGGLLLRLAEGKLEREVLTVPVCADAGEAPLRVNHTGDLHDARVWDGSLYLAGAGGWIFHAFPTFAFQTAASEANPAQPRLAADGKCALPTSGMGADLRVLVEHEGVLHAAGEDGLVLRNQPARPTTFNLSAPVTMPDFDARAGFVSHLGGLHLLDARGVVASCATCSDRRDGGWTFPELPVPSVRVGNDHRRALLLVGAAGPASTTVAGQGGVVLDLAHRGFYPNQGDWTVVNPLVARDGGAWQTKPQGSMAQGLRFHADDEGRRAAADARLFRVTVHHFVQHAKADPQLELRMLFEDFPNFRLGGATQSVTLCPRDAYAESGEAADAGPGTACHRQEILRTLATFRAPTQGDRWERLVVEVVPPTIPDPANGTNARDARFSGLEFFRETRDGEKPPMWAVDDVLVEALVGTRWVPVMSWYGPRDFDGVPPDVDRVPALPDPVGDRTAESEWIVSEEVFGYEPRSAWHLSTALAERPVFVLNDEQAADGLSTSAEPHLRSGWNARLISPVLDLAEAYDPVVSFRHLYSFRTHAAVASGVTRYQHGDTGRVEVQWLKQGPEECPGAAPGETCGWSAFVPVTPAGGYPNATGAGFGGAEPYNAANAPATLTRHEEHDDWGPQAARPQDPGKSWWGRNMDPNERNAFDAPADLSNYQEVRVNLKDLECGLLAKKGCIPTLAGRKVRVAFHAITAPDAGTTRPYNHTDVDQQMKVRTSFGREGWYVADFKVLGARQLGVDLRAENLTFPVGFDWKAIGVGPGTKVPVNVTVANRGAFEALGYTAELLVRKVVDPLRKEAPVVERLVLPQQAVLDPGERRNHTLVWNVPADEGARYLLELRLAPVGIDRDEDPTDNLARLGGFVAPVLARTHRDHRVEILVTPEDATTDITRYVPIFIHNTGNVPQEGVVVTRNVTLLQGPQTRVVDTRTFQAVRAVPQGQRVPLAAVADLNPSEDLFWKAPERANFLFGVGSVTPEGDRASDEKRVSAFATFLFDDVDGGLRGESAVGGWTQDAGWTRVEDEGFRSGKSLAFGDEDAARYPDGADASLVSPPIDLSGARSARVAFYHRYQFEPRFDAGLLEASADGGRTWTALQPLSTEALGGLGAGYAAGLPLSAASALHPTGDPGQPVLGFTGDSATLPGTVDGWALSQFDLTGFDAVVERDVPYESFRSEALAGYLGTGSNATLSPALRAPSSYTDKTWMVGAEPDRRYWEVQNLTQEDVRPVAGEGTFWWSGSALMEDDGRRPLGNNALNVTLDLRDVQPDEKAVLTWWEWADRYGQRLIHRENSGQDGEIPLQHLRSVATFHPDTGVGHTWRYNVTEPLLVAKQGKWLQFSADMTSRRGEVVHAHFVYAPVNRPVSLTANAATIAAAETQDNRYVPAYLKDRGFALDGLTLAATKVVNGQPATRTLLTEEQAWAGRREYDCDRPGGTSPLNRNAFEQTAFPCYAGLQPHVVRPVLLPGVGRSWSLVPALPGVPSSWKVVPVVDEDGRDASRPLPSGAAPRAWWTGDTRCLPGDPCQTPGAESRLVTPMIDLGRVAGDEAVLTFDHRYAFHNAAPGVHPFASGGVVEIQELDPQTGQWGPWRQLYAAPHAKEIGPVGATAARDGVKEGLFGGYSGYTVNATMTYDGQLKRYDPPFEALRSARAKGDVQFLYTGNSSLLTGDRAGWTNARFDVSDHVGKKVRFGFHASFSAVQSDAGTNGHLGPVVPDTTSRVGSTPRGGWWIGDVEIVGKVLKAEQVLLRLRAVTDANVGEGFWQVDDLGVFGARYGRAVGVFADETRAWGAVLNETVTIPVTIRNMGDSVRRDLAVEVRLDPPQRVTYEATAPKGTAREGDVFRMAGFTLGPGRSTTVNLTIRAPAESPEDVVRSTLLVDLKEYNPSVEGGAGDPFEPIPDNEVQGILHRELAFEVAKQANVSLDAFRPAPAVGRVGEPVEMRVDARNVGHAAARVDLACEAHVLSGFRHVDHTLPEGEDVPVVRSAAPCEQVSPPVDLAPGATTTIVFRAVPADEGILRFALGGGLAAGNASRNFTKPFLASAAVGRSPVAYAATFDTLQSMPGWRNFGPYPWSARGHSGPGSLLVGVSDAEAQGTSHDYSRSGGNGANYTARTPPIDTHNLTGGAYLSFWHQDRFARWDGGQVAVQVKRIEGGGDEVGWSDPCVIRPVGGYEGFLLSFIPNATEMTPRDVNPAAAWLGVGNGVVPAEEHRRADWFVSDGGTPEDKWTRAVFDLRDQPACEDDLTGRTLRFVFTVSVGSPNGVLKRGLGQGWLIDDLTVGPLRLELRPVDQKGLLLDNTTKSFSVLLRNHGSFPDVVRLRLDETNSSTPAGSVSLPAENLTLAAGETRQVIVNVTLPRDPSLLPATYKARVVAQSLLDVGGVAGTVLDLAFLPRPWAELSVAATAPPLGGHAGAETFVPIVVENNGLVESVPAILRVTDRWAGGETVTDLELPAMPSFFQKGDEASRTIEFRWRPAEGSVGDHVLTFEVDPDGRGQEYTRENNRASLVVPVGELPLPDLDVSQARSLALRNALGHVLEAAADGDVLRYEATAGELVTLELKVHNRGKAGATNVQVRAAIGTLNLPTRTLPYVGPGAEVAVPFNWLAQKGEHALEFQVVTEQFELTTANNRNPAQGVTLLTVKGFEVGVEAGRLPGELVPGSVHRLFLNLTNPGNAGEDVVLTAQAPKGVRVLLAKDGAFLRSGEKLATFGQVLVADDAVAGQQFISITASARGNPMKAVTAQVPVHVEAHYGGSVVPGRAEAAPPELRVPVRLANEGNSLEPWTVDVRLPAGWTAREALPAKVVVPARGGATLDLHVTVPAGTAPGPRPVQVVATMPNGEKREGTVTVDVKPLRAAALALAAAEPTPAAGGLAFPLTVENKGNVRQPFEMILVGVPVGVEARLEPATFELAPGERANATLTLSPGPRVADGTYSLTGYAAFQGVNPDTAEGRLNQQALRVPLQRPSLTVPSVEAAPRADVKVGDRVAVKAPVLNGGTAEVLDLPVHLYVDDVFIAETRLARLAPGARAEVVLNWTALPGKHVLTVVVDPWNDTLDGDRADNAATLVLDVGTAAPIGGFAAKGIPGPAPLLVLLAALGAALVAARRGPRRP